MKKKNGFTLVELLAVIVVLALILILVVPSVLDATNKSKKETFYLYSSSLEEKAVARYTQDMDLNKKNIDCAVYDISKDLGIGNTGDYEGWVKVNRVATSSGKTVASANIKHDKLSNVFYCVTEGNTCTPNTAYSFEEGKTEVNLSKTIDKNDKLCYNYKYADEDKVLRTSNTTCIVGKETNIKDTYKYEVYLTLTNKRYKVENILINKDMDENKFFENMISTGELSIYSPTCDASSSSEIKGTTTTKTTKVTNIKTEETKTTKVTTTNEKSTETTQATTTTTEVNTIEVSTQTTTTRQTYSIPTTTIAPENRSLLLESLSVAGYNVSFNSLTFSYEITVPNSTTSLNVSAIPVDATTKVTVIGSDNLTVGSNIIRINLANENESDEANYYIEVKRMDELGQTVEITRPNDAPIYNTEEGLPDPTIPSSDALLSSIKISGYPIDFDKNKFDYELTIFETDKLPIQYYTSSEKARAYMEGNEELKDGSKISIYVTSENGYYKKVYTITVHIKKESNVLSNTLKYIVIGLGITLLALLVIVSANKRAKRRVRNKNDIVDVSKNDKNI